jgi:hypothetical protein
MAWTKERIVERLRSVLLGGATLVLIGLVFYLGARSERSGFVQEVLDPGFRRLSDPVLKAFRGRPPAVARLEIILEPAAFDSLSARSERAYAYRRVLPDQNTALAGRVRTGERELPVVVDLRPGLPVNSRQRSWPVHVRALPGDTVQDMQSFDVVAIDDEAPLWSILLHAMLQDQGLAGMKAGIAEVRINNEERGLCALYGGTDATMLARWSRGNGPVLYFDPDLLWNARAAMAERTFPSNTQPQGDWLSAPLLLQGATNERNTNRARKAIQRMEAFRAGGLKASQVFDANDLAKTMALCDLLGTTAAMDWWNLRFAVDSVSEQLVAIPLHITEHAPIASTLAEQAMQRVAMEPGKEFAYQAMKDPVVRDLYFAHLDTMASPGWWEVARERTRPLWEQAQRIVNAAMPRVDLDLTVVEHDRRVITSALYPADLILAYVSDTLTATDGVVLSNVHALPVGIIGVVLTTGDTARLPQGLELEPRQRDKPLHYTFLPLNVPGSPREILVRIGTSLKTRSVRIRTWSSFTAS